MVAILLKTNYRPHLPGRGSGPAVPAHLVYNTCLEQKRLERNRSDPRRLSIADQHKELRDFKSHAPWLREVPHHCLQQAVVDLHRAFTNFFEGRAAYPKPRRKYRNDRFRYPGPKQIMLRDSEIFLPKARWVKIVAHRKIVGTVKNVTVSLSGNHWYASLQVEREIAEPAVRNVIEVGGDLGVVHARLSCRTARSTTCRA